MHYVLAAARSINGFITDGDNVDPRTWTSTDDKLFLSNLVKKHDLLVYSIRTYDALKPPLQPDKLQVILTRTPEKYTSEEVVGSRIFASLTPTEFDHTFSKSFDNCLILGGSQVYADFLESNLVDEAYITIEPLQHSTGVPLLPDSKEVAGYFDNPPVSKILNAKGTILEHYT